MVIPVALLFRHAMIEVFADSSYSLSGQLLPFFFFAWVFDLFTYFAMLGTYKTQNSVIVLCLFFLGTILIALLNFMLVPVLGLFGAAVSFSLTKMFLFAMPLWYFRKEFKLTVHIASFFIAFFVAAACSYLTYQIPSSMYATIMLVVTVITIFYLRGYVRRSKYLHVFKMT